MQYKILKRGIEMDTILLAKEDFKSAKKWNELLQRLHLNANIIIIELELNGNDSVVDYK